MKLVLAEKPSVAQSIAKVLGAAKREDGYLEGNGYVVSWCVGHLVELAQPEVYDAKYSKWAYADLPIFPMDWQYEVSAGTKKQFGILKKLMAREDVASLVCATDAGREGELIFRLVYHKAGCRKPFERLWISSMEDVAIKEGFENLRSGTEYDALYEAALCRERADWIVGINATRLFSTLYGQTLNVGRVMTPTLAMAVMREAAISAFKPELFYTVQIGLDGFTAASERFKTKAAAEAVKQSCSVAIVQKAECKEKTEKPPALYDLTSLQREANRVLGYTAQQTLDYTQNLYEKKLVTYPRTDSRFLTEDMAHSLTDLVKLAFHTFPVEDVDNIPVHAEQVVNNKKVTDHHAIIPTRELQKCNLSELPKGELAILQLISNRLCVAVGDPHRYAETVIELDCGGTVFSTKGKTVVQDGWKALVQKNDSTKSDENVQTLPSVSVGDEMTVSGTEIKEGKTSPPKHFTEDTLLSAMETAGADEMPDEVERKGLGTPATRAGIIEKLVRIGFLERKGDKKTKHLIPTHKGTALVTVMPEQIQSPSMTADWEEKLLLIEKGEYASEDFMDEIKDVIAGLIQNYEVSLGYEEPDDLRITLATIMMDVINEEEISLEDGILHHQENVDLLPANIELSALEVTMGNVMSREMIMKEYIDAIRCRYDYILIDCMPSLGMMTINALVSSDSVLIPVQAAYLPVKGLQQLIKTILTVKKRLNRKLAIEGILLTMVDFRTNYARDIASRVHRIYQAKTDCSTQKSAE